MRADDLAIVRVSLTDNPNEAVFERPLDGVSRIERRRGCYRERTYWTFGVRDT